MACCYVCMVYIQVFQVPCIFYYKPWLRRLFCMIQLFYGRPRNGKSLHATQQIYWYLTHGKNVISNYMIDESQLPERLRKQGKLGKFIYVPDSQWLESSVRHAPSPSMAYSYLNGLYGYAKNFHKLDGERMIEDQTLLVFDECHNLWNPRTWNRKDRLAWADFFRQHGHWGYQIILITQDDTAIDKQIRGVIEMKYEHRNVKNFKAFGWLLSLFAGGNLFVCIQSLYGMRSSTAARVRSWYFRGKKKYYRLYNTTATFGTSSLSTFSGSSVSAGGSDSVPQDDVLPVPASDNA